LKSKRKNRILVIDDEEINIDIIKIVLHSDESLTIDSALNGVEAIELAIKHNYDSFLLDLIMPGLSGVDVLKKLRSIDKYKATPILMITSDVERKHEVLEHGATDFIPKPFDIKELKLRLSNYLDYNRTMRIVRENNLFLQDEISHKIEELENALQVARESQYEIAYRLAKASEFRDIETGMHLQRMSRYSALLAKLLGFSKEEQDIVLRASPLHDVGKIGIRDAILLKPGRYTAEEFENMKQHTIIGGNILSGNDSFPILKYGKIIALEHHEKVDGTGYPLGKKGDEIHPYARIVSIADVFDALSSKRVYKKSFSVEETLEIMEKDSGKHFDEQYLSVFIKNLDLFLEIKEEYRDEFSEHN
jgi:putative two-component system response regulator